VKGKRKNKQDNSINKNQEKKVMSIDATIDTAKNAAPVSPESPEDRKKGDVPSYKIKNHLAIWIEGDQAFVLDQDKESSVKKIPIAELAAVFKRPGMDFIFYDAEPTLKLLATRNIAVPGTFHCAHTQVILALGHQYKFHKIDSLYEAVYDEGRPTTPEARAFALWWLHGEYLTDPEVHGSYILKIEEIKKKSQPKQQQTGPTLTR
jgi:hypothetical protein